MISILGLAFFLVDLKLSDGSGSKQARFCVVNKLSRDCGMLTRYFDEGRLV